MQAVRDSQGSAWPSLPGRWLHVPKPPLCPALPCLSHPSFDCQPLACGSAVVVRTVTALVGRARWPGSRGALSQHRCNLQTSPTGLNKPVEAGSCVTSGQLSVLAFLLSVVRPHFFSDSGSVLLFPAQEELGRTVSQLIHAFQTAEAREYPRRGEVLL